MHYSASKAAFRIKFCWSCICSGAGLRLVFVGGHASAQACMVKLSSQGDAGEHMMYSCSSKCQHP